MSHVFRYRTPAGSRFESVQDISVLIENEGAEPLADRARVSMVSTVGAVDDDGAFEVTVDAVVTEQMQCVPPIADEHSVYRVSARGELVSADPVPPSIPFITFAEAPVDLKETWKTVENCLHKRVAMEHTLTALEPYEGDTLAHVVTEGTAAGEPAIDFFALRIFSIQDGFPKLVRAVLKYAWSDGRNMAISVDQKRV